MLFAKVSTEPKIPFPSAIFTVASFPAKFKFPFKFPFRFAVPVPLNIIFEVVSPELVLKLVIPEPRFVVVAKTLFSNVAISPVNPAFISFNLFEFVPTLPLIV